MSEWQCGKCHGTERTGVQYQGTTDDWDGVSEWQCCGCGLRVGRWSGMVLRSGEIEGRYGRSSPVFTAMETRHEAS